MAALPTGTVTFLFMDIEGSTRLLEQLKDAYADVLAGCRRLVRTAVQKRGGQEVDTEGDAVFAVFPSAREALLAAVSAQQHILRHPWPDGAVVRVRMGLHTGEARVAEGGYVGMDVHRAARICAVAHGGQILVSDATQGLVTRDLPDSVSLRDLGEHRLKDLAHAHRLFQVLAADIPTDFPRVRSLDSHRHNLPIQLTSFIGRGQEIAEVKRLLRAASLVTLTGSGGAGKTRLALQVAADVVEDYRDGVWLAEFAPITDPVLVPKTVASALNVPEQPGREVTESLVDAVRPKALLLVLDNCEHLLTACADLAAAVLRACPQVRVLATSREALGIPGETLWRTPSLSVPDVRSLPPSEEIIPYDAVRLFVDRAVASAPGFTVTRQNAPAVAQVCQQLDGIPLAIELAAARVKVLAVEQIAARLDDRFRLLTGASRVALPRHQTLRAAMDWSYDLLSAKERAVLRRLSVFAGGWTLESAEAICAGDGVDEAEILDLLAQLVNKSLVAVEAQTGAARYRLLETVRQYARNKLLDSGEVAEMRRRHVSFFLALAEAGEPHLTAADQDAWLKRLAIEHDNLRAALECGKTEEGGEEKSLRLAGALWRFWNVRGYWSEGRRWLEGAVTADSGMSPFARAKALFGAGVLAWQLTDTDQAAALLNESLVLNRQLVDKKGIADSLRLLAQVAWAREDYDRATALGEESLALFQELGDKSGIAAAFRFLGFLAWSRHDIERGRSSLEQSLALARKLGDRRGIAWSLYGLGHIALGNGDYERATKLYEESLVLFREMGDQWGIANSLERLGILAKYGSDYARAGTLFQESLAIRKEVGDKLSLSQTLRSWAWVSLTQKDFGRATVLYGESLSLLTEVRHKSSIAGCFEGLGQVAEGQKEPERAARLFGAADRLREDLNPPAPIELREIEQSAAKVRAALGEEVFQMKRAEGRAMTLEQAIEYAVAEETK